MRPPISVYILAYNEARKIGDAIKSVQGWADEVVVIDSFSTDETPQIARQMGTRLIQVPFRTFGQIRNEGIRACTHEWIFSLDADERMTDEAKKEIDQVLCNPQHDLYYIPRKNWFFGRWIRHCGWYPDYRQPQLFRKGSLIFNEHDEVHEGWQANGSIGYLKSPIVQIPFLDLEQMIHKMQRYSTLGAQKLQRKEKNATMWKALLHAMWSFFRIYFLKLGFLDGWAGFLIAFGNFEGTFYRYAKLYEYQNITAPEKQ